MNIINSEKNTDKLQEVKQNVTAFLYMIEDLEDGMVTPEDILGVLKIVMVSIESYISRVEYGEPKKEQSNQR